MTETSCCRLVRSKCTGVMTALATDENANTFLDAFVSMYVLFYISLAVQFLSLSNSSCYAFLSLYRILNFQMFDCSANPGEFMNICSLTVAMSDAEPYGSWWTRRSAKDCTRKATSCSPSMRLRWRSRRLMEPNFLLRRRLRLYCDASIRCAVTPRECASKARVSRRHRNHFLVAMCYVF